MSHATGAQAGPDDRAVRTGGGDPKWWTLGAVCLGVFMLLLDITIVNVALHAIQVDLSASLSQAQWVLDAYALSLAALLLTAGSLADLYGRKRVFIIGLVVFTLGSTLCGVAPSVLFLSIARAAQGIGGAAMFATALALLASAFTGKDRGVAFAAFGATTGVSVAIGPVLGGALTSGLSWRWIFFVNIPLCALALLITIRRVQESHDPKAGGPDWVGFGAFSIALAALVYGLIEAGQRSFGDPLVVLSFVVAAALFVAFLVSQRLQQHPMFDLRLLRKPTFTGGLIAAFMISATIFSLLTYIVLYLQGVLGFSAIHAGLVFLFLSGTSLVASIAAGRLTERVPIKYLIGPGFAVVGVGLLLMLGISHSADSGQWTHLAPGLLVAGFGVGMINPPLASTAVGVVPTEQSGMASGVNSTFRQVGIATGIAALGSILAHQVTSDVAGVIAKAPPAARGPLDDLLASGQVRTAAGLAGQQGGGSGAASAVSSAGTAAYVDALNHIIVIGMVGCFLAAVLCFFLIRQQDFEHRDGSTQGGPAPEQLGGAAGQEGDDQGPRHADLTAHEGASRGGAHAAGLHAAPVADDGAVW